MKFLKTLFFLVLLSRPMICLPQSDSSLVIGEAEWKELCEDVDYTETYLESEEEEDPHRRFSSSSSASSGSGLKYFYYGLVLVAIVLIVLWLTRNLKGNAKLEEKAIPVESVADIEEKMHELDLEHLLKEALSRGDFRLALRLNFLIVIKLLSQKGHIQWAKEKTNWEYYSELSDRLIADQFREVINSFESFWYGEHPLDIRQYYNAEGTYKAMQERLKITP